MERQYLHPYYIVSPPYVRTSAGTRVLYRLADMINASGGRAYIFLRPRLDFGSAASPTDIAPFLTTQTVDYHFSIGLTPIVIYPEVVNIRKFTPPVSVRYLLNYNNLLAKSDSFQNDSYILCYSRNIQEQISLLNNTRSLYLSISDHNFFHPPKDNKNRSGACFYAGKYKYTFQKKTLPITDNIVEITRDQKDSQSPEEIRTLFQTCELFYCYEDSALSLEAILCGCPTIFIPNEYFHAPLGAQELQGLGYAWGTNNVDINHAKATVLQARDVYISSLATTHVHLKEFLEDTQLIAKKIPYTYKFQLFTNSYIARFERVLGNVSLFFDTLLDRGMAATIKIIYRRIRNNRLKIRG